MYFTETYVDNYSWSQWLVQSIMFAVMPRFTTTRLDSTIKEESKKSPATVPDSIQKTCDVKLLQNAKCRTHVISPLNEETDVVLIFIHGGAYVGNFMVPTHFNAAVEIGKAIGNCEIYLPEYPLVPNVTHESLFEIIESVYRQIVSLKPNHKIALLGDSAGGGAVLILTQRLVAAKKNNDTTLRLPDTVFLMSPWLDVSMSDPQSLTLKSVDPFLNVEGLRKAGEYLANGIPLNDPRVSPLFGSLDNLPPINVFVGTHDIIYPDSRRLRDRIKKEKIPIQFRYFEKKGLLHCFFLFPGTGTPEAIQEIREVVLEDCGLKRDQKIK